MAQKAGGFTAGHGLLSAAQTLNFTSGRSGGGMASGGSGGPGLEQMGRSQVSSADHLNSTSMKLFSSLGLSPSDLDALAQIPEDQISVETLPHILRQLKSSKNREGFTEWDKPRGREGPRDVQFAFRQDSAQSRDFGRNFGHSGDFSQLSRHDSAGYMQGRAGKPSPGQVEDFLGMNPARFPHVCLLCDFDVHSMLEWNQHINGLRHVDNRRVLLNMYPDWEPPMSSSRSGVMDTPNLSDGLLGPAPMSGQTSGLSALASGLSSGWGGGAGLSDKNTQGQNMRVRVVVVKYERRPLSDKSLFSFVEPFGQLREHLLLKNKGFLEMSSHEEALDVVNYYQQNPATLGGRPLVFELSKRLFIEKQQSSQQQQQQQHPPPLKPPERGMNRKVRDDPHVVSQVVYFSNLPREEEKKKDLLTIAGRFGTVEKHLFLSKEGFIQLSSPREAEMMEKYYTMNPLVVRGHQVRCNVCAKYKTLNVPSQSSVKMSPPRGPRRARSPSPRRSTERRRSPDSRSKGDYRKEERSRSRQGPKAESKPGPKGDSKPGPKANSKSETKAESKPEVKAESKSETKTESKPGPKAESKPLKKEPKPESKAESKPESKPGKKSESKPEPKAESKPIIKESKPEPKAEPKPESKELKQEPESSPVKEDSCSKKDEQDTPEDEAEHKVSKADGGSVDTPEEEAGAGEEVTEAKSEEAKDSVMEDTEGNVEEDEEEEDFFENMDDMVVVDELQEDDGADDIDNSEKGGMRVVMIMGFKKGYNLVNELMQLAQPFGKVVRHLILDMQHKAYLQFTTEEQAVAMAKFYNGNVQASVCGRAVKIWHYTAQPTIQFGFVVYIGKLPDVKYSKEEVLELVEKFGNVRKYFLHYIRRECFIEMETEQQAERVVEHYKLHPAVFYGHRLTIYVSRKYRVLRGRHVVDMASERRASKRDKDSASKRKSSGGEPPAKKTREDKTEKTSKERDDEKKEEGDEEKKSAEDGPEEEKEKTSKETSKEAGDEEVKEKVSEEEEEEEEGEKEEESKEKGGEEMSMEEGSEESKEEASEEEGGEEEEELEEPSKEVKEEKSTEEEESPEEEDRLLQRTEDRTDQDSDQDQSSEEEMETDQDSAQPEECNAASPEGKPEAASLPLPPYDPHTPLGAEHVKLGYYCRVCFLFYSSEEAAKRTHCSSQEHYDQLQKYLEKKKLQMK